MISSEELDLILLTARKHSVKKLQCSDFVVEFNVDPIEQPRIVVPDLPQTKDPMPTEDEMLLWSVGGPIKEEK